MKEKGQFGWGMVGLGSVAGARFAPAVRGTAGAVLAGCMSRDHEKAKAFAGKFGIPSVHPTLEALLADREVDAVYIATPNSLHAGHAELALRAGKHVLCEKPLALSEEDGRRVVERASEAQRLLGIAFQFRFEPVFARARAIVGAGRLGELRSVVLLGCSPAAAPGAWRSAPEEGGILSDLAVHLLDIVPWITGLEFTRISACASPREVDRHPVQTISVFASAGERCHVFVQATREVPGGQQSFLVEGTKGLLWCPAWRGADDVVLVTRDAQGEHSEAITGPSAFNGLVAAFASAVQGEPTSLATGADGLRSIRVADGVRRAAREGSTVAMP